MQNHYDAILKEMVEGFDHNMAIPTKLEDFGFSNTEIQSILAIPADWALSNPEDYDSWEVPNWAISRGFHTRQHTAILTVVSDTMGRELLSIFKFHRV